MSIRLRNSGAVLTALVALGGVAIATSARAEEPLRWKFKVGEKLDYNMTQEMAMSNIAVPGKQKKASAISWIQYVKDCGPKAQQENNTQSAQVFGEKYKDKEINWIGRVAPVSDKPMGKGAAVEVNMDPLDTKSSALNVTLNATEKLKAQATALKKGDTVGFVGRLVKQGSASSAHEVDASEIVVEQAINTTMRQELNMTWDVQGVDEKSGEAVVRQKFARVKMRIAAPLGTFEYDSASEEVPTGPAAMIAPMFKAMTEGEFEITMTSRGEVIHVKIPEEIITMLKSSPHAAEMGDIASADGLKKMLSQGALVLPKDLPKKGDAWKTTIETKIPSGGKQIAETTYSYVGSKDIKGTMFAVFQPQLTMEFVGNPVAASKGQPQQPAEQQPLQMKIKEQSSDGEVLFNIKEGRLQSTMLKRKVSIETTMGGESVQQMIDQKIDVTVSPAGEKKSDAAKKPVSSGDKAK